MHWSHLASYFFGGAFLANAVPHLVSGMVGQSFQTPFAKPPGKGVSSSTVNVFWGLFNLVLAYLLLIRVGHFRLHSPHHAIAVGLGIVLISLPMARYFGRFNGGNTPGRS